MVVIKISLGKQQQLHRLNSVLNPLIRHNLASLIYWKTIFSSLISEHLNYILRAEKTVGRKNESSDTRAVGSGPTNDALPDGIENFTRQLRFK